MGASELRRIYAALSSQSDPVHRVGWRDQLQQFTYFEALVQVGVRDGHSALDVGCGQGDLYAFLDARGLAGRYTGIDLSPELVASARERFPHSRLCLGRHARRRPRRA